MGRDARARLLEAALTLLDAQGVAAVSVDDIRVAAEASVGSLYHHFPGGKPALVDAVLAEWLGHYRVEALDVLAAADGHEAGVRGVVTHFLRWAQAHPAAARVLLRFEVDAADERTGSTTGGVEFFRTVTGWLAAQSPPRATPTPIAVLVPLWIGPTKEYARAWLAGRSTDPPALAGPVLADAAWESVRTRRPAEGDHR